MASSWGSWGDSRGGGGTTTRQRTGPLNLFGIGGGLRRQPTAVAGSGSGYPSGGETTYPVSSTPGLQPGANRPPNNQFGTPGGTPWYNSTGLRFNDRNQVWNPGAGAYVDVYAPPWMGNPQEFYGGYQSALASGQDYADAYISNTMSQYEAEKNNLAQTDAGRRWLTGQMGDVDRAAESWAQDPYRQQAIQGMSEMASPEYQFFSPTQRSAATVPVGQQYALSDIYQRGGAAGRGTAQGGQAGQANNALAIQAATGGQQIRAQIDAQEQALKQQALANLAGTTSQFNAADTAYMNAGNQLAGALGALESGVQFEPTDYSVWPALNDATQRAQSEQQFRDDALAAMEKEAEFDVWDLANTVLSSLGSGGPEALMGMFG